jgi:hypothetical protein
MRIYLPLTVPELRRLGRDGTIEPAPITAYAVTTDLRRDHPSADEDELEYLAFLDAAGSVPAGAVRVVAAADVDADAVGEVLAGDASVSQVRVALPVPKRRVASLHVAEATGAGAASNGIPEFSWYDATELEVVLDLLA